MLVGNVCPRMKKLSCEDDTDDDGGAAPLAAAAAAAEFPGGRPRGGPYSGIRGWKIIVRGWLSSPFGGG